MTVFMKVKCEHCGKVLDFPINQQDPFEIIQLKAYRFGWTYYLDEWHCQDCRPRNLINDPNSHPVYHDYNDYWGNSKEKKSHEFLDEQYDRYADVLQDDLCKLCDYCHINYEDDGSHWLTCIVEDVAKGRNNFGCGHNLYSGHFYGAAICGRFCPYFKCPLWKPARDPKEDQKNGTFHVPYDEKYDGD